MVQNTASQSCHFRMGCRFRRGPHFCSYLLWSVLDAITPQELELLAIPIHLWFSPQWSHFPSFVSLLIIVHRDIYLILEMAMLSDFLFFYFISQQCLWGRTKLKIWIYNTILTRIHVNDLYNLEVILSWKWSKWSSYEKLLIKIGGRVRKRQKRWRYSCLQNDRTWRWWCHWRYLENSVSGSTTFGIDCSRGEGGLLILKQPSRKNKIKRKTHTQ